MITVRSAVLGSAFAVTVAAAVTGLSLSGETRESSLEETCAHVTWPSIPAFCLEGGPEREVRMIATAPDRTMRERFQVAFR